MLGSSRSGVALGCAKAAGAALEHQAMARRLLESDAAAGASDARSVPEVAIAVVQDLVAGL